MKIYLKDYSFEFEFNSLLPNGYSVEFKPEVVFNDDGISIKKSVEKLTNAICDLAKNEKPVKKWIMERHYYVERKKKELFLKEITSRDNLYYGNNIGDKEKLFKDLDSKKFIKNHGDIHNLDIIDDIIFTFNVIHQIMNSFNVGNTVFIWENHFCPIHKEYEMFKRSIFDFLRPDKYTKDNGETWLDRPTELFGSFPVGACFKCKCGILPMQLVPENKASKDLFRKSLGRKQKVDGFFKFCKDHNIYKFKFRDLTNVDKVLTDFEEEIIPEEITYTSVSILLYVIGKCYYIKNDYIKALKYLTKSLEGNNLSKNTKQMCLNLIEKISKKNN